MGKSSERVLLLDDQDEAVLIVPRWALKDKPRRSPVVRVARFIAALTALTACFVLVYSTWSPSAGAIGWPLRRHEPRRRFEVIKCSVMSAVAPTLNITVPSVLPHQPKHSNPRPTPECPLLPSVPGTNLLIDATIGRAARKIAVLRNSPGVELLTDKDGPPPPAPITVELVLEAPEDDASFIGQQRLLNQIRDSDVDLKDKVTEMYVCEVSVAAWISPRTIGIIALDYDPSKGGSESTMDLDAEDVLTSHKHPPPPHHQPQLPPSPLNDLLRKLSVTIHLPPHHPAIGLEMHSFPPPTPPPPHGPSPRHR